jgi:hypothetical protein
MFRLLILGTVAALVACGDNVEPVPAKSAATEAANPALSADPTAAAPATATIPPNFQGEWNATLADCGTGRNETRLRVAADRVVFYESSGNVRSVEQHAEDELSVFLERAAEGQVTRRGGAGDWRTRAPSCRT